MKVPLVGKENIQQQVGLTKSPGEIPGFRCFGRAEGSQVDLTARWQQMAQKLRRTHLKGDRAEPCLRPLTALRTMAKALAEKTLTFSFLNERYWELAAST